MSTNSDYIDQLNDWERSVADPFIWEHLDTLLPKYGFKMVRNSGGRTWVSPLKIDLSQPKVKTFRKTFCQERDLTVLREQGDWTNSVEVIQLIGEDLGTWGGQSGLYNTYKELSDRYMLNMPKPKGKDSEVWKIRKREESVMESLKNLFIWFLNNSTSPDSQSVRDYLTKKRGFSEEFIESVGFGFVPSWGTVRSCMEKKGFTSEELDRVCPVQPSVGKVHLMSIPYQCGGKLKGFLFRRIDSVKEQKYCAVTGMDRSSQFFNITGLRDIPDLIIVEGELDSLTATSFGVQNVVSIGGPAIRKGQVEDCFKKGVKRITLCLDLDSLKDSDLPNYEKRLKMVRDSVKVIQSVDPSFTQIYVASFPEVTDPDLYIRNHGVRSFSSMVDRSFPYWKYYLSEYLRGYGSKTVEDLTDKEVQDIVEEFSQIESEIPSVKRSDILRYRKEVNRIMTAMDLPLETYQEEREKVEKKEKEDLKQRKEEEFKKKVGDIIKETQRLVQEEDFTGLRDYWSKNTPEILQGKEFDTGQELLKVKTEEEITEEEMNLPESLSTGFMVGTSELLLHSGSVEVFVAPTNHGKTWFLLNLLMNVARKYPDKKFLFLSYEERENKIIEYLLNIYMRDLDIDKYDPNKKTSNRRTLAEFYQKGQDSSLVRAESLPEFRRRKEVFFKEFIEKRRTQVKFVTYNSQQLFSAIWNLSKSGENIGGIFIDYIQKIKLPNRPQFSSRAEEMKSIMENLNSVSAKTGLPLVFACQFNRSVTSPFTEVLNNIGEAGDIERNSDQVFTLWNCSKKIVEPQKPTMEESKENGEVRKMEETIKGEDRSFHGLRLKVLKGRDMDTSDSSEGTEFLRWRGNNQWIVPNSPDPVFTKKEWEVKQEEIHFSDLEDLPE